MKLTIKQKELLKLLVKGKGEFKTPIIPKTSTEKNFNDIVQLYLKGLLTFKMKHEIDLVGPSNEHMVRFKWYVMNIDKSKTLKDIKKIVKDGKL